MHIRHGDADGDRGHRATNSGRRLDGAVQFVLRGNLRNILRVRNPAPPRDHMSRVHHHLLHHDSQHVHVAYHLLAVQS